MFTILILIDNCQYLANKCKYILAIYDPYISNIIGASCYMV